MMTDDDGNYQNQIAKKSAELSDDVWGGQQDSESCRRFRVRVFSDIYVFKSGRAPRHFHAGVARSVVVVSSSSAAGARPLSR